METLATRGTVARLQSFAGACRSAARSLQTAQDGLPVGLRLGDDYYRDFLGGLALLSDFYKPERAQSGVMLFCAPPEELTLKVWVDWMADPEGHMRRYRGDGEWLRERLRADRLQRLFPGSIVSYKAHCRNERPGPEVRLVSGHGNPRFSMEQAGWAHRAWCGMAAGCPPGTMPLLDAIDSATEVIERYRCVCTSSPEDSTPSEAP